MFKPMLAPNEQVDVETLNYPLLASYKIDGIRAIFLSNGEMLTRSLKPFPNQYLVHHFQPVSDYAMTHHILLDGELYAKSLGFNALSGLIRRFDSPIPEDMQFLCFDSVENHAFDSPFIWRIRHIPIIPGFCSPLEQVKVWSPKPIWDYYERALALGCDGLILRDPNGHYKQGRGTIKEKLIYKLKPYQTFDGTILDIVQATVVDPYAEKTINELGHSVTSQKIGDRIPISMAADFVVLFNNIRLKVSIALTHEEKKYIWANRKSFMGKVIEYKGMMVGAKDLPRHPIFLRFREDLDEKDSFTNGHPKE